MTAQELRHPPGKYRLTIADYALLHESGALGDVRSELIDGKIVVMAPECRPHAFVRDELSYRLRRALEAMGSDLYAGSGSVQLSERDMPQPDIVVTSEPRGEGAIPLRSIRLLVEVSSTTLTTDLGAKAELYAGAGIPEYWVVDVDARTIRQLWSPTGQTYSQISNVAISEPMSAKTIAGLTIDTSSL